MEATVRSPGSSEAVVATEHISLDPYLAPRFRAERLGDGPRPITSRMVGRVLACSDPAFPAGTMVLGFAPWREHNTIALKDLQQLPSTRFEPASFLGPLGHSGVTAWLGVNTIGRLERGETMLVSGAAGAVGSVAGQLGKAIGARVVGVAGGPQKCEWVRGQLGFDDCIDYRSRDLPSAIAAVAPEGIDLHFENVGTSTLDPALGAMSRHGRVVVCGLIEHYQNEDPATLVNFRNVLTRSVRLLPFSIYDHPARHEQARAELLGLAESGRLSWHIDHAYGIENLPRAYVDMLAAKGFGKHVLSIGEPAR